MSLKSTVWATLFTLILFRSSHVTYASRRRHTSVGHVVIFPLINVQERDS